MVPLLVCALLIYSTSGSGWFFGSGHLTALKGAPPVAAPGRWIGPPEAWRALEERSLRDEKRHEELQRQPKTAQVPAPRVILFIPPLTGSQLEAKAEDKPDRPGWWCARTWPWHTLWLAPQMLLPWQLPCYVDNMRLLQDLTTGRSRPVPGVTVRLAPCESALGPCPALGGVSPFASIARALTQRGYTAADMETHCYDWRLGPVDWMVPGAEFDHLRAHIESLAGGGAGRPPRRRVVVVSLSLGAPYFNLFLTSGRVDEAWKAAHIHSHVSISGSWLGTPVSVWDVFSGRLQGFEDVYGRSDVRDLMRGLPVFSWVFPVPDGGDGASAATAVMTNTALGTSYRADELGQALRDAGAMQAARAWDVARPFMRASAPNVTCHCIYSRGVPTAATLTFHLPDFSDSPEVTFGDGDVTVPLESLAGCEAWRGVQQAPVHSRVFDGLQHAWGLLQGQESFNYIVDAIVSD